ncbi:MAG TPA: phospholipase D family protein [Pseudomonadales bacterium]
MNVLDASETALDSSARPWFERLGVRQTVCAPTHAQACVFLALGAILLNGCATVPKDYTSTPSFTFQDHASTTVGAFLEKAAAHHPDQSGFAIFPDGRRAFTSRIAMTELAEKTLDLQYFIWDRDATGRILVEHLIHAADRGVRVRILVDDLNLEGDRDVLITTMDAHPNIEVRIFNPFANRSWKFLGFLTDFNRLNHRMHNKLFVMDNAVAIVGGRNIGDHYFDVHQEVNFRDLDVIAGGPVVREASTVFDHFWNGPWSVPIAALVNRSASETDLRAAMVTLHEQIAAESYPYPLAEDVATLKSELTTIIDGFIWAPGHMIFDDPNEVKEHGRTITMTQGFYRRVDRVESELLIEVPYFVVRDRGMAAVKSLRDRGVRIRVLTNSLASNDVLVAHAGHAEMREELIAAGVELYELRAEPATEKKTSYLSGSARSSLHCKAFVFDRKDLFIGSLNLDPRSGDINTEAGLYIESAELSAQVIAYMNEGVLPRNSFHVLLDAEGHLYWVTETDGKAERYDHDPNSTFWQRVTARIVQMLPIRDQI